MVCDVNFPAVSHLRKVDAKHHCSVICFSNESGFWILEGTYLYESICLYFHQDIHVHKCSFLPLTRRFLISMSAVDGGFRLWDQEILDQEAAARQACGMCMCILRMSTVPAGLVCGFFTTK